LRQLEPTNCSNLEQAGRIWHHPNTSSGAKLLALGYVTAWSTGHVCALVAASIIVEAGAVAGGSAILDWLRRNTDKVPAGTRTVSGVVSRFRTTDIEAIERFADEAPAIQAARKLTSFGSTWKYWAQAAAKEADLARNTYVHRTGERVTGMMVVSDVKGVLRVSQLEAFGEGAGTRLLQAAIRESLARGYQGQLTLRPAVQAVDWYLARGFAQQGSEFFLTAEAAQRLLTR
jgi:hypothetical protein